MPRRRFKKYTGFIKAEFLGIFAYRFNIWGWIVQDVLTVVMTIFLWIAIYNSRGLGDTGVYQGFTLPGMVVYMMLANLTSLWTGATDTFRAVGDDVYEGAISISLTKPISYRAKMLSAAIGAMMAHFVIFVLPLTALAALGLYLVFPNGISSAFVGFNWYNIIFYFIQGVLALIIVDSLDFMVAQVSFISKSVFGLHIIKGTIFSFLSGGMIPYAFFGDNAAKVLSLTPFACLASSPINMIMGRYSIYSSDLFTNSWFVLGVSAVYAIALYALSDLVCSSMIKHVESAGG